MDAAALAVRPLAPPGILSVIAFHEKAGRSQGNSGFMLFAKLFLRRPFAAVAMLPSALSRSDWFRSVHVGRSRFSRCCHLFGALWFCSLRVEPGPGHRRSHRNSALGFCLFSSWNGFAFLFYAAAATVDLPLLCNGSYTSPLTHR